MSKKIAFLVLAVAVLQVTADYVEPRFIEDVLNRDTKDSRTAGSRIVSGWDAIPGQHPHQAALRMVNSLGTVGSCGASFVHKQWLLTAAHCTAQRVNIIVLGGLIHIAEPEFVHETTEWWNYPTYNEDNVLTVQPDDISLLKLQSPVTYTRNLKAIRIQSRTDAFRNYANEVVHTSGFGRTWTGSSTSDTLQWVYLRGVSNSDCVDTFGTIITANTICARWFNVTSQSTCHGDSGGPLVHIDSEGRDILIGVTSFVAGGDWGCHSGLPAGFIRPGPFHSWFQEVSGIDFENIEEDDGEEDVTDPTPPEEDSKEDSEEDQGEDQEEDQGEGDSSEEDSSSESDEDGELSELMKRLQVKVKVKVTLNKFKKHKKVDKIKAKKH